MKKEFLNFKKSRWLLLVLLTMVVGANSAWADELTIANGTTTNNYIPFMGQNADYGIKGEYIIPSTDLTAMSGKTIKSIKLYAATNNSSTKPNYGPFQIYLKEVDNATPYKSSSSSFLGTEGATLVYEGTLVISSNEMLITFESDYDYQGGNLFIGFYKDKGGNYLSNSFYGVNQEGYTANSSYSSSGISVISTGSGRTFIPKTTFTYENNVTGPALSVYEGTTKLVTGFSYNFGLATAGTEKTFTLKNPGTEDVTVNIAATNGFGVSPASTTITAKGEETLTVTMANATGNGTVTITPTESGVDAFTINVGGTLRDANKVYIDFDTNPLPSNWVKTGNSSTYATFEWTESTGYIGYSASSSAYYGTLASPKLVFEENEKIFFETAKYSDSQYNSPSIRVDYSTNGTDWITIGSAFTDDVYGTWTPRYVEIPTSDAKYIRFYGWNIYIKYIYGGEIPTGPNMVVTQPSSLDYGVITEATPKTFTIANTGLATLEGINVTSSNNSIFAITGTPTTLDAGESAEVTITMAATTVGNLSSVITVSATDMENVEFTVTGTVLAEGMSKEEFTDGLPANWTNASWTFADGIATGKSSSAYLTTPKLVFAEGDLIVIKARRQDSDTSDYLTVQGSSDNGSTWTAYSKKLQSADGLTYPDFGTIVLNDIPTTVNKLRFVGYYAEIDEIWGLNYAPVLSVTTGDPAAEVATPANYDFGECAADATITYNFANAGAGTINITNVEITGDGAAAYSTNWTESVATPFDLTITRSYDAERTEAQEAVVTVTTSEGEFVINVTGTDKAANAPEIAVTLGGEAVTTGDAANFGTKLQAAPSAKTYTITNSGTGTLTGTIATSDDTQFTVSKTEFSLGAAESTTFDLALVYNTTYGAKAATITIHPTVDGLEDIVINATASTLDPEAWTEDFSEGTLPTGWTQGTWTIGTFNSYENKTTMALAPSGSSAGTLITPCLSAKAGEVLTWDGYFNWYDEAMTVEYSNDNQETWTKIYDAYKAQTDFGSTRYTHKEMSFTAPADGDYYLRFTSTYSNGVDNFAGFKLNLPDHIMAITASSIPTSNSYSPTMKATKSFEATVTVKESRGVAEENVVAKLYMDDEVIGTSEATAFAANESKQITITATPTVAATEGAEMHIEVEYAGGTLKTANETRYVAELVRLDMAENSAPTIETGYSVIYDVVTLTRNFAAGWNTFVAPQAVSLSEFEEGTKAYSFTGYENGELKFAAVTSGSLNVATPYIIYVPTAINEKVFTWNEPVIYSSYVGTENIRTTQNSAIFQGTYAPVAAGEWTKNAEDDAIYGVTSEGKIAKAGATASINGFRAYFDLPAGAPARLTFFNEDGTTTSIMSTELNKQDAENIYNLQGQKVTKTSKAGLYIKNGKKVIVK